MDYQKILIEQRQYFNELSKNFLKEDFKFVTNKNTFTEKRVGVFTRQYYKRKKLIQIGSIIYGYVIRIRDEQNESHPVSSWVLFSPQSEFEKNPANYEQTMQNLNKIIESEKVERKYKRLKILLCEPYAEPCYFELPKEFTNGDIAYLSHAYFWKSRNPNLKPGLAPIFINQNISKEVIYLPEKYWTDQLKKII